MTHSRQSNFSLTPLKFFCFLFPRKNEEISKQLLALREEVNKLRKENEQLKSGGKDVFSIFFLFQ